MDTSLSKLPEISERQRSLAHGSPWGHRVGHDLVTEQQKGHAPATEREGEKKIQIFHFEEKLNLI